MNRVLILCHASGVITKLFQARGWDAVQVDLEHGHDVRLIEHDKRGFDGVIAEPPCTEFAGSGARWWEGKGEQALLDALAISDACLRAVAIYRPNFWWLENPVGRLKRFIGPPAFTFNPNEYAGYCDNPGDEAYTKRTCIWGNVSKPLTKPVPATLGSKMHLLPPSKDRAKLRSITPTGFARAMVEMVLAKDCK